MTIDRQLAEQGRPAGFVSRLIAITIDLAILAVIMTIITVISQFLVDTIGLGSATKVLVAILTGVFALLLWLSYFVGLIAAGGQLFVTLENGTLACLGQ